MEIQMLKRKLQTTTKDSYFITLPKPLIQALELQKGDNLTITLDGKKIVLEIPAGVQKGTNQTGVIK